MREPPYQIQDTFLGGGDAALSKKNILIFLLSYPHDNPGGEQSAENEYIGDHKIDEHACR
jgi:hypothetical protein